MTIDDLPEYPTLNWQEAHGLTRDDVLRRCPGVVEYGSGDGTYFHRDDLAGLCEPERGAES
jgi:hypothetical protein